MLKPDSEIQEKINDCKENKMQYVEWLCQNKTEKQLERLLKRFDKLYEFAVHNKIVNHIELINLWKDQVNTSLIRLYNFDDYYTILKKIRNGKKFTFHEKIVIKNNYDWFYNRIYGLPPDEKKICG
ncbi:MAG: hypothetical protein A3H98_03605 [Bacteroidetes bacterium RIFCSPLOWO2_02_FULL_36_8]|nr:MAG: hypothetical protein A3H98_03605 [Bacteroidetes bacterium RIFCSPLOWO2_02_FULL_36_8]OFY69527.1 MAG: hypothetical protein A3G23_10850 [Bacteroidetes bacterium RIFCSPLOWO2_12_FULL_37_12]